MNKLIIGFALFVSAAMCADITGKWKGTAETPNGTVERTFVFKQDGEKLTGTTESQMLGASTIAEGKVVGDDVSFAITAKFQDQEMKLTYKGKLTGNELKLHVETPDGSFSIDYVAKKTS